MLYTELVLQVRWVLPSCDWPFESSVLS